MSFLSIITVTSFASNYFQFNLLLLFLENSVGILRPIFHSRVATSGQWLSQNDISFIPTRLYHIWSSTFSVSITIKLVK